jgi:aminoglycoside phosphotransferase (APT) family kinase protein
VESPPADVLAWAEAQLGRPVVGATHLPGGLDAPMFRLRLDGGADVVLRIAARGEWHDIEHLAQILELLASSEVPAPTLLAHGAGVGSGERPVMLQSLLPGDPTLPLEPTEEWLRNLVATNLAIQRVAVAAWVPDRLTQQWAQLAEFDDDKMTEADQRLVQAVSRDAPGGRRVLGHDDYWIGNTLRTGDRVVGVVDWGGAGLVSPARDLTYCAVDMSLCYGVEYGDRLVSLFRGEVDVDDVDVDLWTARAVISARWFSEWLQGWNGLGVPVQHDAAALRRAELLDRMLTRLG